MSRIASANLGTQLINLDPVSAHAPIHNILSTRKLHIPLLNTNVRGVVSLDNLVQGDRELLPAVLGVLPQLLDGREDDHGILRSDVDVDHLSRGGSLQLPNSSLQSIVLFYVVSFLANKETEHTDPVLFPGRHSPEAVRQTGRVAHRTRGSVPRLVDGVHVVDPDVDEVIKGGVVQGHVVCTTIQLVLVEGYQASVVNKVVYRQPLLEDVPKVLLGILRPIQGRIDDL